MGTVILHLFYVDMKLGFTCDEQRLRLIENWLLRKMFLQKAETVTGGWRKLHDEFHDLFSLLAYTEVCNSRRADGMYLGEKNCIKSFGWEI